MFGIVTSLLKNSTKQSFFNQNKEAPVSFGCRGFFHLSDTVMVSLFRNHLYIAITVSFEIDTAVFAIVDIEGVVVFVLLVVAAIETDRVIVQVTTLDIEFA